MKTEYRWLIGKIVVILIMLFLLLLKRTDSQTIGMSIGVMLGIAAILFFRFKHPEKYMSDERLEKLSLKATMWSWTITFFIVISIYWLDYLGYIKLSGASTITILFWVMICTIMALRYYFIKRPE